jgi:hypothetical protein
MMTFTFSKNMAIKNMVLNALFLSALLAISLISQELRAQSGQALSAQELEKINQQPISKPVKNNAETGKVAPKKPSFEHKESDGTSIKEYKEGGKATEIIVESPLGTKYELSSPSDAAAPNARDKDVNRVPTVRMSF